MGRARIHLGRQQIADLLQLPPDVTVQALYLDPVTEEIICYVEAEDIESGPEGPQVLRLRWRVTRAYDAWNQGWQHVVTQIGQRPTINHVPWGSVFFREPPRQVPEWLNESEHIHD